MKYKVEVQNREGRWLLIGYSRTQALAERRGASAARVARYPGYRVTAEE